MIAPSTPCTLSHSRLATTKVEKNNLSLKFEESVRGTIDTKNNKKKKTFETLES
jgi:hypothetical protein